MICVPGSGCPGMSVFKNAIKEKCDMEFVTDVKEKEEKEQPEVIEHEE